MAKHGLVKTLKDGEDEIKLVGNAMTFILYKSYFGRDLLNDIVTFAKANSNKDLMDKIMAIGDIENIAQHEAEKILDGMDGYQFDTEFVLNFMAALMATAQYPQKPDVGDLIMQIPPHFLVDREIVSEVIEFLSLFIKQKANAGSGGGAPRGSV